jgi:hypothetical protein
MLIQVNTNLSNIYCGLVMQIILILKNMVVSIIEVVVGRLLEKRLHGIGVAGIGEEAGLGFRHVGGVRG